MITRINPLGRLAVLTGLIYSLISFSNAQEPPILDQCKLDHTPSKGTMEAMIGVNLSHPSQLEVGASSNGDGAQLKPIPVKNTVYIFTGEAPWEASKKPVWVKSYTREELRDEKIMKLVVDEKDFRWQDPISYVNREVKRGSLEWDAVAEPFINNGLPSWIKYGSDIGHIAGKFELGRVNNIKAPGFFKYFPLLAGMETFDFVPNVNYGLAGSYDDTALEQQFKGSGQKKGVKVGNSPYSGEEAWSSSLIGITIHLPH